MADLGLDFLTMIESRETRLLAWGYVEGGFTLDELTALGDEFVLDHDRTGEATGDDLVAELRSRALLLDVDDGTVVRYRSRMAETVRLLARLRQLFPRHQGAGWAHARTLVADYRLLTRPRVYPRRDLGVDQLMTDLGARSLLSDERREAVARLTGRRDQPLELSRFQVDATVEILAGLDSRTNRGTIVGAGTGSGKTLAFYLPALSHVVTAQRGHGTRVLAIYPRIELLRDQFAETYREARRLDGLTDFGRPVRIAALYGSTPQNPNQVRLRWKSTGDGWVCPYMPCPTCGEGRLAWSDAQLTAGVEELICAACGAQVSGKQVVLTRQQMLRTPPDVLFTTTEMLNRMMLDGAMRRLIGVGPNAMPIDLVLLDEVHTYEGSTGAQVAGLLRRWRHAHRRPVHFVGLSATLRRAGDFFADITGLSPHQIAVIEPGPQDLEYEGQEYMVAVRSDPTSGASVLSTTIQTAMLMQRGLDPIGVSTSQGAMGQRLFAFTDDLDVTNRLFFDLRDAEGLGSFGRPEKPSLAALRAATGPDLQARRAGGQTWEPLERIGHRLDDQTHVRIGRTTSQDADVDRAANAIVATASLEVGFNDPRVGAVIQHKSPHDTAAFLQRKGRAGRTRGMRPWTLIVLSDFGRDRTTYQAYERLFDPDLPARSLPVSNPAVLRMQATYALLDWLTGHFGRANIWRLLTRPPDDRWANQDRPVQEELAARLRSVLEDPAVLAEVSIYLAAALGIDEAAVRELLWEPPRPLLTTVVPTAIRRLVTGWQHLELGPQRDYTADGPLPDFIVSRLFGDLALPEVTVVTPPQRKNDSEHREPMRAFQALNAYAPGRVSHRLQLVHRGARHWVAPPVLDSHQARPLDIRGFIPEFEEVGVFGRGTEAVRVIRPLTLNVDKPPPEVLSSSYGRLRWQVEIIPTGDSDQRFRPPRATPLASLIDNVTFHTHGGVAHVEIRRWAVEADIETLTQATAERGSSYFADGSADEPRVGLGLALDVDGLCIELKVPERIISDASIAPAHLRSMRIERFLDQANGAESLIRELGGFAVERIARAAVTALIERAIDEDTDLATAYQQLGDHDALIAALAEALGREHEQEDPDGAHIDDRAVELLDRLREPRLIDQLRMLLPTLWTDPDANWDAWARERLAVAAGAAFHAAIQALCPEYDADDLVIDPEPASFGDGGTRVWLTEQTIGGGGILHEAFQRIGERPRRFFELVAAATEPSVDEIVDSELSKLVVATSEYSELRDGLAAVRSAVDQKTRIASFEELNAQLERAGVFVCHPVVSALSVRFLRPASDARIDDAARELLARWRRLEERLGVDIDLRIFARLDARHGAFDRVSGLVAPHEDPAIWRAAQITSLLWPRGFAARAHALHTPNPFATLVTPDVALLRAHLPSSIPRVAVAHAEELLGPGGSLARDGEADLVASPEQASELRTAVLRAAATAVESGPLLHFPRVDGIRRTPGEIRARLVLDLVGE
jgi:hypothetical protein